MGAEGLLTPYEQHSNPVAERSQGTNGGGGGGGADLAVGTSSQQEHSLTGHAGAVLCFIMLEDRLLFSGSADCTIKACSPPPPPTSSPYLTLIQLNLRWHPILDYEIVCGHVFWLSDGTIEPTPQCWLSSSASLTFKRESAVPCLQKGEHFSAPLEPPLEILQGRSADIWLGWSPPPALPKPTHPHPPTHPHSLNPCWLQLGDPGVMPLPALQRLPPAL